MKSKFTLLAIVLLAGFTMVGAQAKWTINVLLWDDPYPKALMAMLPEFEKATNITVNIEMLQPPQVLTKTAIAVTATSTDYDVVGIDEGNVPVFASLLQPFDSWPKGKVYSKTDPKSITPKMYSIGTWNGVQLGVPINGNLYVWMTRKDLIENPTYKAQFKAKYKYDLGVPKTFKELLEMGTFFYENNIAADPKGVFSMFI